MKVCLARHGITAPQEEGRYCGHSDPPLSQRGVEQIVALRARLAEALGAGTPVYCSDLRRSVDSAALLVEGGAARPMAELREIHFGAWEGLRFAETGCTDAERLRDAAFCFPGGESVTMLRERVGAAWRRILREAHAPRVLIVAHAGPLGVLRGLAAGKPEQDVWEDLIGHGEAVWVEVEA